jgi:GMC oxidoreductase
LPSPSGVCRVLTCFKHILSFIFFTMRPTFNKSLLLPLFLALIQAEAQTDSLGSLAGTAGRSATFDYVVIGAGTAGLTLATRLAEDKNVTVAIIEPGTYYEVSNTLVSGTPAADVLFCGSYTGDNPLKANGRVDWSFVTEPQKGANNRKIHFARGKCLGGTYVCSVTFLVTIARD